MNDKQELLKDQGVALDKDEIVTLTGSTEGGWEWVEEWFTGMDEEEILAECNRTWPGEDNEYLAWSIYEHL